VISIQSLEVKPGQRLSLRLWQRLLKAIEERTMRTGRYVRLHHSPDGVIVNTGSQQGGTGVVHSWQMTAEAGDNDGADVSFYQRGLVNGVEAQIRDAKGQLAPMCPSRTGGEVDPDAGDTPKLTVSEDKFDSAGVSRIYAKITVNKLSTTSIDAVELIASEKTPTRIPFTAFKLIGFILMDDGSPTVEQHCFFDQTVVWGVNPQLGVVTAMFIAA
jgi:hypothetical protein